MLPSASYSKHIRNFLYKKKTPYKLMKKEFWITITVLTLVLILLGIFGLKNAPTGKIIFENQSIDGITENKLEIKLINYAFSPNYLEIKKDETVTWKNYDNTAHIIVIDNGIISFPIQYSETFVYTFNEVGTYNYYCEPHPYMRGKIIVK